MRKPWPFILGLASLWMQPTFASFELSPIIANVAPSGSGTSTSFTLTNADDTKTPIQISIFRREPDLDGKEKYEPSKQVNDLFQIFPSQVILNAKEKRTVRVTYVGDPKVLRELSFRIIAEEFPINVSDPKKVKDRAVASIAIATKYVGSLYVTPMNAKADVKVEASHKPEKTGNQMVLMMENQGSEHLILKHPKFKIVASGQVYEIPYESISSLGPQNILAGMTRKFSIPWPNNIPVGPVKVSFELPK